MSWLRMGRVAAVALAVMLLPSTARADCPPGVEFCNDSGMPPGGGIGDCWSEELQRDICNEPPDPCPPESTPTFKFIDDQDGSDDGQLMALAEGGAQVACGTLTVTKTAYYRIFDTELSESCKSQMDETGYLTIENSCNPDGWAVEANAGDRYLVVDSDNTPTCSSDGDCSGGRVCRLGNTGSKCCVPAKATFMGTFLLVAGENNKICLHHWCPDYLDLKQKGEDPGFVFADCKGVNSIHFRIDSNAVACEEDTTLKPCTWGCENGKCLPDPCETMSCPKYCKDGVCLETNPCEGLGCKYGCKNGRCLQPPSAPGPDGDGDGYPWTADCDDSDPLANPSFPEVCGNGKDDDCDGFIDEPDCQKTPPGGGGSGADGTGEDGCGCRVAARDGHLWGLLLLLAAGLWLFRRRAARHGAQKAR